MNAKDHALTEKEVERLASMVRQRLAEFGDPAVRAPLPSDYRADRHWGPHNYFDFAVDIDIGATVLTLRIESRWNEPSRGRIADLNELAKAIWMHVFLARRDEVGVAKLRAAEAMFRAKIVRDRSYLSLVSTRFAPGEAFRPSRMSDREMWVKVELLDDMLLPYTELITGRTVREICRELKHYGAAQLRRMPVLERLTPVGAVLEIEASAEHAIVAIGRRVGDVAREILSLRKPDNGCGQPVTLWGDREAKHVSVIVRDGRIHLEADLPGLRWSERAIVIAQVFPDTLTIGLVGRPLRSVVDHPLLRGDAEISDAVRWKTYQTEIQVAEAFRPVRPDELDVATAVVSDRRSLLP